MEVKIESGQVQISKKSGKEYTNCKLSDGSWINIWGNHVDKIGQKVNINEPQIFGKTKWTSIDKSVPEPKSESLSHGVTKLDYLNFMEEVWEKVMKLEPDKEEPGGSCAEARAALINTAMIAFSNNKIVNESQEPDEPIDEP